MVVGLYSYNKAKGTFGGIDSLVYWVSEENICHRVTEEVRIKRLENMIGI
jgi:hypothetical protein